MYRKAGLVLFVLAIAVACAKSAVPDRAWREHFDAGKLAHSSGDAAEAGSESSRPHSRSPAWNIRLVCVQRYASEASL